LCDHLVGAVAAVDLLTEPAVLALEPSELERAADGRAELVVVERLGDVVERALAHRGDGRRHARVRGEENYGKAGTARVQSTEELDAVHLRHLPVGDHGVGAARLERGERRLAARAALAFPA